MAEYFADIVWGLHLIALTFYFWPWILPAGEWLKYLIIIMCLFMLDWSDRDQLCFSTAIENKLRGEKIEYKEGVPPSPFTRGVLKSVLGIEVSEEMMNRIYFVLVSVTIIVSLVRYCIYKKISLISYDIKSKIMISIIVVILVGWTINNIYI